MYTLVEKQFNNSLLTDYTESDTDITLDTSSVFTTADAYELKEILTRRECKVIYLTLRVESLHSSKFSVIVDGLIDNTSVQHLDLRYCLQLGLEGAYHLRDLIKLNKTIKTINLADCEFTIAEIDIINTYVHSELTILI